MSLLIQNEWPTKNIAVLYILNENQNMNEKEWKQSKQLFLSIDKSPEFAYMVTTNNQPFIETDKQFIK